MSQPADQKPFPKGYDLIQSGRCPIKMHNPIACWVCSFGHSTECHYPKTCDQARCSHYEREMQAERGE